MKTDARRLFGVLLGATLMMAGGCATRPAVAGGYEYWFDDDYCWYWQNGYGWGYLGRRGEVHLAHNGGPGRPCRPCPPGAHCPEPPGQGHHDGKGCYVYVARDGSVLAGHNGSDYKFVGYVDHATGAYTSTAKLPAATGASSGGRWSVASLDRHEALHMGGENHGGVRGWLHSAFADYAPTTVKLAGGEGRRVAWSESDTHNAAQAWQSGRWSGGQTWSRGDGGGYASHGGWSGGNSSGGGGSHNWSGSGGTSGGGGGGHWGGGESGGHWSGGGGGGGGWGGGGGGGHSGGGWSGGSSGGGGGGSPVASSGGGGAASSSSGSGSSGTAQR